jgi:hypothetical protein
MTVLFDNVHSDDLDPVTDKQGKQVFSRGVRLMQVNVIKAEARRKAALMESINGCRIDAGQEDQAAN